MKAATKIRLLSHFRPVFPVWTTKRQASVVEHAFDLDLASAKNSGKRQELLEQRYYEASEYWNAVRALRSKRLVDRAHKLYIDTSGLNWQDDNFANHYLDDGSQANLNRLIVEETRKTWEFRMKIVAIVVTALTGLAGTLIGLVAVLKKR